MSSKIPLLLLPGMMCDARLWEAQIDGLADICEPITVGDITAAPSIALVASQVLQQAPATFALAGLSMGGIVAFEMWRQAAQRISHLALLDTNARAEIPERQALRQAQIDRAHRGGLRELMIEELKPNYLAQANKSDQRLLDCIFSMAQDCGPKVFENQSIALRDRQDSCTTLSTIDCPTLLLCGAEDQLCPPAYHHYMANEIPAAQLIVLKQCGHLSTLEQPQRVTQAMRGWLGN